MNSDYTLYPTTKLRWIKRWAYFKEYGRTTSNYQKQTSILQQLWANNIGESKWQDIEEVEEKIDG